MAKTNPNPPGFRAHTVAAKAAGLILLVYALLMTGQAVGLFSF
ncbi:MAG: hypothetical protein ACLFWF_12180 [Alphaproteobacteria bacterium]